MNLMVVIGFLLGVFCIYYGVPELKDTYQVYLDPHSFVLVFGGTIATTIISTSFKDFRAILTVLSGWMYFKQRKLDNFKVVEKLVAISEQASKNGKSSVVEMGAKFGDGFLDRALNMMSAGLEPDFVRAVLETDVTEVRKRHFKLISMVRAMGSFAPMFGMMGTVMGVMQVLRNVADINSIVSGMSLALLTTLYGLILASMFFIPLTNKLKFLSEDEALQKEMMMEGVLAIMNDFIPIKVEKMLMSYLSSSAKNRKTKKG
ncbi:MAG: MotA/TolQ/ExbB proton channel family protein [bacterium]|nr:MotA/TolQ/ExbB proton channel family protein [bacterium]